MDPNNAPSIPLPRANHGVIAFALAIVAGVLVR